MVSSTEEFKLDLPKPKYRPIRLGQSTQLTRLDLILQAAGLTYQDYILYVEAFQKSTAGRVHAEVFLILHTQGIVALPRQDSEIIQGQAPWTCNYTQIESVHPVASQIPEHFGIRLNFYNRDADASNVVVVSFDCKEQTDIGSQLEERKAGEAPVMKVTGGDKNLADTFLKVLLSEQSGMKPMEFSVLYLIQRMLPLYWQQFFEKNVNLTSYDYYQFHAFIVKRNSYFFNQRRFIVLTKEFMINVEADFDKTCSAAEFKSVKWKVPLASLKALQLEESGSYFKLTFFVDLPMLNTIMKKHGAKKDQKKEKRALKFVDRATLRDFVFHLKRLYHWHRRSRPARQEGNEGEPIAVTEKR